MGTSATLRGNHFIFYMTRTVPQFNHADQRYFSCQLSIETQDTEGDLNVSTHGYFPVSDLRRLHDRILQHIDNILDSTSVIDSIGKDPNILHHSDSETWISQDLSMNQTLLAGDVAKIFGRYVGTISVRVMLNVSDTRKGSRLYTGIEGIVNAQELVDFAQQLRLLFEEHPNQPTSDRI